MSRLSLHKAPEQKLQQDTTSLMEREHPSKPSNLAQDLLALQRLAGNQAVTHVLQRAQHTSSPRAPLSEVPMLPENSLYRSSALQIRHHLRSSSLPSATIQRKGPHEEEMLQEGKEPSTQRKENHTGLPDTLKAGVEQLSGLSMDDVRVHYNSPKPAEVQALAYTQGTDIHMGPGQERHLPHEAWHVVQQQQGRVKPTLQARGVEINDDQRLEKEADVIGKRAAIVRNTQLVAPAAETSSEHRGQPGGSTMPSQVVQMKYKIKTPKEDRTALKNLMSRNENFDLKWIDNLGDIYKYIDQVKEVLDDDEDIQAIKEQEDVIDKLAKNLDALSTGIAGRVMFREGHTKQAKRTRTERDEPPSPSKKSKQVSEQEDEFVGNESKKRTRGENDEPLSSSKKPKNESNEAEAIDPEVSQWEIAEKITQLTLELGKLKKSLEAEFSLQEGGFSAKARAHKMGESEDSKKGHKKISTWFENITIDNKKLDKHVYKQTEKVPEKASEPQMHLLLKNVKNKQESLANFETLVKPLKTKQKPANPLTSAPIAQDRQGGQVKNMANVNASAYARMAEVPNWKNSRWEWLHIRAASLGGKTDGSNLVLGTRDANTHMMPFEANIRLLANVVNEDKQKYKHLKVKFLAIKQDLKAKHKVGQISIEWNLVSKAQKNVTQGKATFNPLDTAASISKTEIDILEKTLKAKRDEIK
jgi:hypothetical protein